MTATLFPKPETSPQPEAARVAPAKPAPYRWSREQYERAVTLGLFGPDTRIELIEGVIIQKMPRNDPHQTGIGAMQEALNDVFAQGHWVRIQLPLRLGDWSMPEPDFAVVSGSWRDYRAGAPTTEQTRLVVEVSDSSLLYDPTEKASMYARAGIQDYWIVNLAERVLEVGRRPETRAEAPFGYDYAHVLRLAEGQSIAPLTAKTSPIAVADLLP